MAGRGTDVRLGSGVPEIGGMHVILTEMHDAARIDRQLVGRCGRQGDPGSFRYFLSLDDDLLRSGLGVRRFERLKKFGERVVKEQAEDKQTPVADASGSLKAKYERLFRKAQRRVERRRFQQRKQLLAYERQRNKAALPLGLDPHLDLPG
jgi:preprotein translocase subunit SecA